MGNKSSIKRVVLLVFLFSLVVVIGWLWKKESPLPPQNTPQPTIPIMPIHQTQIPVPLFPIPARGAFSYTVRVVSPSLPNSVPVVTQNPLPMTPERATQIASSFGFLDQPQTINSNKGTFYSWQNDAASLLLGGDKNSVVYNKSTDSTALLRLTDNEYVAKARQTINKYGLLSKETVLGEPRIKYFYARGPELSGSDRNTATQITLEFPVVVKGFLIAESFADEYGIKIELDGDGNLAGLVALLFPDLRPINTPVLLKDAKTAINELESGAGALLQISTGDLEGLEIPSFSIKNISITSIEVAYYINPEAANLSVVYLFRGTAYDAKSQKNVQTITLLDAVKR